jgi:hypothetical protein
MWRESFKNASNSSCDVESSVFLLGKEREEKEEKKEDPCTKWRMKSSKSMSILFKSIMRKLDKLKDNEERGGNTFAGLRCCSNPYCDKTGEKSIKRLFMFVKISGELSGELIDI